MTIPVPLLAVDELALGFNPGHVLAKDAYSTVAPLPMIPQWNTLVEDHLPRSESVFQHHINASRILNFDLDAIVEAPDPAPLDLPSPQFQKEAKQRELLAVQHRLLTLQAELAATP